MPKKRKTRKQKIQSAERIRKMHEETRILLQKKEELAKLKRELPWIKARNRYIQGTRILLEAMPIIIGMPLGGRYLSKDITYYQKEAIVADGEINIVPLGWEAKGSRLEKPNLTYYSEWMQSPKDENKVWRMIVEVNNWQELEQIVEEPQENSASIISSLLGKQNFVTIDEALKDETNTLKKPGLYGRYEYFNKSEERQRPMDKKEKIACNAILAYICGLASISLHSITGFNKSELKKVKDAKTRIKTLEEETSKK